ncbi:MAG: hypothetical protein AAFZ18_30020 [Myxococcota bacterium]
MLFLIAKISLLLLIAALAGAGLMYWWVRRRFEDVTVGYKLLFEEREALQRALADRDGVVANLHDRLDSFDLAPIQAGMVAQEQALRAGFEGLGLETQLEAIRTELARLADKNTDLEPVIKAIREIPDQTHFVEIRSVRRSELERKKPTLGVAGAS